MINLKDIFKRIAFALAVLLAIAACYFSFNYAVRVANAALPETIQGREYDKFVEVGGVPYVRVTTSAVSPASVTNSDNRKVVASAGTAEAITATSTTFTSCDIQAEEDNTGDIVIGSSTVVAALGTRRGILLTPGTSYHAAEPNDLANIYIDSEVNGDGVTYWCRS